MKVKDLETGNVLESENQITVKSWNNNPERYEVINNSSSAKKTDKTNKE